MFWVWFWWQGCSISIANALEILQSCTKPSIYSFYKCDLSGYPLIISMGNIPKYIFQKEQILSWCCIVLIISVHLYNWQMIIPLFAYQSYFFSKIQSFFHLHYWYLLMHNTTWTNGSTDYYICSHGFHLCWLSVVNTGLFGAFQTCACTVEYSALPIYRGPFSPNNSWKRPIDHPP